MRHNLIRNTIAICFLALALISCTEGNRGAVQAVENYLQALIEQDADRLINYSCAEWEASAIIELDSFTAVSAELENLQCQEVSQEGSNTQVNCSGKIIFDYNGEIQEFDLAGRSFAVREEAGEWRMCGYR